MDSSTGNNIYYRVRVKKIPSSLEAEVTEVSFLHGCNGLSEVLSYIQKDLVYEPEIRPQRFHDIDVFFNDKPSDQYFNDLKELNDGILIEVIEETQKDWLEEWKKGFKPFHLVGPFWVIPSWFEAPPEAEAPLYIDPGMAFGTGTHATTQMAAALVHRVLKKHSPESQQWRVLDVGTGTAILAMMAKILGAKEVTGIDIDPEARRVGRENIQRNKVQQIQVPDLLLEEIKESYDLVIANIIDGVLLSLKSDLFRVSKNKGFLIVTGILEERENQFLDEFLKDENYKIDLRLAKDEWVGYLLSPTLV